MQSIPQPTTKTQVKPYTEYLKSDHWKGIRRETYKRNNYCYICGNQSDLNIHHLTYKDKSGNSNLYGESIKDLVVLCRKCHYSIHAHYGKKPQTPYAIKKLSKLCKKFGNLDKAITEQQRILKQFLYNKKKRVKGKPPAPSVKQMGTMAFYASQKKNQVLN